MVDVLIIGAGTAGLTAALYANRAGLKVMVLEKAIYGGQIVNTPLIENYPALAEVSGFDFVQGLFEQAVTKFQTPVVYETIQSCMLDGAVKTVVTEKRTIEARCVILAAGAEHRKLGCDGEERLKGRGVSYCATCDGAFFRGKDVAVVGGGNTALQDARYLANHCKKVYLIHRRDAFRAAKIEVEQTLARENVVPVYDSEVEAILGDNQVQGIRVKNRTSGTVQELAVDGVFVAVGLVPASGDFSVEVDDGGYIVAGEDCKTNVAGVFAAGDIRTKRVRQLVTAAADGAVSAEMALDYLNQNCKL